MRTGKRGLMAGRDIFGSEAGLGALACGVDLDGKRRFALGTLNSDGLFGHVDFSCVWLPIHLVGLVRPRQTQPTLRF